MRMVEHLKQPKDVVEFPDFLNMNNDIITFTDDELYKKLKIFDDQNVEELQTFEGENYEDIADAETSDDETFDGIDEDKFDIIEEKLV